MSADAPKGSGLMPVAFVEHGIPIHLLDAAWIERKRRWADALPRPRSILVFSPHWEQTPLTIGATRARPLVYDFSGFPRECYEVTYPAPGAPELATRVRELVGAGQPVEVAPDRGWDHGVYVPLRAMFPAADVPVLQLSLPGEDPQTLYDLGRTLAPLRREGVLILAGGYLTHNLGAVDARRDPQVPQWARDFDGWVADVLVRADLPSLLDYRRRAPHVALALPTPEHFVSLFIAAGAASVEGGAVSFPITGFEWGSFSQRSVQFG